MDYQRFAVSHKVLLRERKGDLMNRKLIRVLAFVMAAQMLAFGLATFSSAKPATQAGAPSSASYKAPDTIDFRTAKIVSEGVRLHAELFSQDAGRQAAPNCDSGAWLGRHRGGVST